MRKLLFILFALTFFFIKDGFSQTKNISFKKINGNQGLSQNNVQSILQDNDGFMWFGTFSGLNKWDGYDMTVYKNIPQDSNSLSNNDISFIYEDSKKNLWIGTYNGLNLFNRSLDNFKVYKNDPKDPKSISSNYITTIYEDKEGNLWIGTVGGGFNLYNRKEDCFVQFRPGDYTINDNVNCFYEDQKGNFWIGTGNGFALFDKKNRKFEHFYSDSDTGTGLKGRYVTSILEDQKGRLWIATNTGGINIYNINTNSYKHLTYKPNDAESLGNNTVYCTLKDKNGNIWIGTENGGLNLYNPETSSFLHYNYDPNNPNSLSNNSVSAIFQDNSGNMWIGVHRGGVNFFSPKGQKFQKYKAEPGINNLSHNNVKAFQEDELGNIWIGTDGGGLNYFDRTTNSFTHYKHDNKNPRSIGADAVISVCKDNEGYIWIGTWDGGLNLFNIEKKTFSHYYFNPKDSSTLAYFHVWSIYEDSKKRLWIGSYDGGLNLYDRDNEKFIRFLHNPNNPNSLISNKVFYVGEDKAGNIWIGTHAGLSKFNPNTGIFDNYVHNDKNSSSLSNNRINIIFADSKKRIWIGTHEGLNLFNPENETFSLAGVEYGLGLDVIQGILEDDNGNLWISTVRGLAKYNPDTDSYHNFTIADGLQSNEFAQNACIRSKSGELLYGGIDGFNIFHPDRIKNNSFIPPVRLTNFQIFNKTVKIGGKDSPLKQHIGETKEIILSYKQSVFSFEFSALNYLAPENNQYAYMLEGFDKEWNLVGTQRKATYTNINPGEYIFKVKGSNNDGVWNEKGTSVRIIITPPFWQTWWFKILVTAIVIGSAVSFYVIRINIIKEQKAELEKQVKERTTEVVHQKEELQAQAENLQVAYDEIKTQEEKLAELYTDVKDSIKAAQVIQGSILPSKNNIRKYLPESFILYKPKDVVSGDFYWFDVIEDQIIIASVDCTGHGVSGAFMSINGFHLLNQCIYPYKELVASEILNRLNESIIGILNSEQKDTETYDGMDVSLCIISKDRKQLQFAGANNPLYILRGQEIIQVKGNRYSIGLSITGKINTFNNHVIDLNKGDVLYLFSDGYADQIGGETGEEKFMYARFRELLQNIGAENMEKQANRLNETLEKWKGKMEQLDDILVMGFKV